MGRLVDAGWETLAIAMVGDGVVAGTYARRHVLLWKFPGAPQWYREMTGWMADRPWLIRAIAIAQFAIGMWLVRRLIQKHVTEVPEDLVAA